MKKFLFYFAVTGWTLGLIVHLLSIADFDITDKVPFVWVVSGTDWKPISIIINRTANNNRFEYAVDGIVEWKLFGATLYSQVKNYRGHVTIN